MAEKTDWAGRLMWCVGGLALSLAGQTAFAEGTHVASVVKAPITAARDVAGAHTDIVRNFAVDPDPAVAELDFQAGQAIRIALPEAF